MTLHLGQDERRGDIWRKMVFSVKTGKQVNPAMVRELWGTTGKGKAVMGGLILEQEPSDKMVETAERKGNLEYIMEKRHPSKSSP